MLKRITLKTTACLVIIIMLSSISMPIWANSIMEQTDATTEDNVKFDATIKSAHEYTLNIDENPTIDIKIDVKNAGYIKDAVIEFSNTNFKFNTISNENITKFEDNKIYLSQITAEKSIILNIPIRFNKADLIDSEQFKKDSNVILNAVYIDTSGKENKIEKKVIEHIEWTAQVEERISQELVKYIKIDSNKTMISFKVKDEIVDGKIPYTNKDIKIDVPLLEGKEPSKVICIGNNTSYSYKDKLLSINVNNEKDENGKIKWLTSDEYMITYIYDTQTKEENIKTKAKSTIVVNKEKITSETKQNDFSIKESKGNFIDGEINGDTQISKGYLYANSYKGENILETTYSSIYKINIGYCDLIDNVSVKEYYINDNYLDKTIEVSKDEFTNILGEDGYIKIFDQKGVEIGKITKDITKIELNNYGLKYETSKPISEGFINLIINRAINLNKKYTAKEIKKLETIKESIKISSTYKNEEISNINVEKLIKVNEPTSNATLEINKDTLSTVVNNEDVVITATLEKNDITDALYKNPTIKITLPRQVTKIELKDAHLLYEDELLPTEFTANGNEILLKLKGIQTSYSTQALSKGCVVRIVANLILDNLSTNSSENITLTYTNEANQEEKIIYKPINLVAPTGFVTKNYVTYNNMTTESVIDEKSITLNAKDESKVLQIGGAIVNNQNEESTEVCILGRFPCKDNLKIADASSLKSTFTMKLKSLISIVGANATVYYSEKIDASNDLNDLNNSWNTNFEENSKSYLIKIDETVKPNSVISFKYNAEIASNMDYDNVSNTIYAVYYNNKIEKANLIIESKPVAIKTESIPQISTKIEAFNYKTGEKIEKGKGVKIGEYIRYVVTATNTGKETAKKVILKVYKPQLTAFSTIQKDNQANSYIKSDDYQSIYEEITVKDLAYNESEHKEIVIKISQNNSINSEIELKTEITAQNLNTVSKEVYNNKIIGGTLELDISSDIQKDNLNIGDEVSYYISVQNFNTDNIKNVIIEINIPETISVEDVGNGIYDPKTKILLYKLNEISKREIFTFKAKINPTLEVNKEVSIIAKATAEGIDENIYSNKYIFTVDDINGIEAKLTSNINSSMLDTDRIEYYIDIRNNSKKNASITVSDILPSELKLIKFFIKDENGIVEKNDKTGSVYVNQIIETGKTIKITIIGMPYLMDTMGQKKSIENNPYVFINELPGKINSISTEIIGTSNFNFVDKQEQNKINYCISGMAWKDNNLNGEYDESEEKLSGLNLKLYNQNKKEYEKNEEGKDIQVITDENGYYIFNNLEKGNYLVIANFDSQIYELTNYKTNSNNNQMSHFAEGTIENEKVGITDAIKINESNIYGINIGLREKKISNIEIESTISNVIITDSDMKSKKYNFENNSAKLNINFQSIEDLNMIVEYKIKVINKGNIPEYIKKIVDHIPKGLKFVSEINASWYMQEDGNVYNTELSNDEIKPGESRELNLILVKNNGVEENILHNYVAVEKKYNEYGIKEITARSGNKEEQEYSDLIIKQGIKTENILLSSILTVIGITIISCVIIIKRQRKKEN